MITLLLIVFFAGWALIIFALVISYGKLLFGAILLGIGLVSLLTSVVLLFLSKPESKPTFIPEYELEILNQDSVAVKSLSTGITYKVRFDQVHEALLKDNL